MRPASRLASRLHALRAPVHPAAHGALETALRAEASHDPGAAPEPRRPEYARLARVSIRHTYYNALGGLCPAFSARPTGFTAALMRSLGLLFRPEANGFSVLYDTGTTDDLLAWLRRQANDRGEVWSRLTFLLSVKNPYFVNFTDIPIDHDPALWSFYLTNQDAHRRGAMVLLTRGSRVTAADRCRVTGPQLVEPAEPGVRRVEVCDISGEPVLCKPRCVSATTAARLPPDQITCADAGTGADAVCADLLYFDLSTLPEDRYTVNAVLEDGGVEDRGDYVYTSLYPMPLGMVDLLFTDPSAPPAGDGAGVYPVSLAGAGAVSEVSYVLRFTRRKTWWNYYVVPQRGGELLDLRVSEEAEAGEGRRVRFVGPCEVRLPGGQRAYRFLSSRPLPLEQRSRLNLRLYGRTAEMPRARMLVKRLPVAGAQQVLPYPGPDACAQARRSLRRPRDPGARCRRLLRHLCGAGPDPGAPGTGETVPPREFSDIYVYV